MKQNKLKYVKNHGKQNGYLLAERYVRKAGNSGYEIGSELICHPSSASKWKRD